MASVVFDLPSSPAPPVYAGSSSAAAPWAVVLKLSLRGDTFRISFPIEDFSWKTVEEKVNACYADAHRPAQWTLVYRDDEEDLVTVNTQRELLEALRVFAELKAQPASANANQKVHMHFHVVAKLSLKEQLAPVMLVVNEISEKMTRIAADTCDSLRKSSYVERGRESIYHSAVHTRDALSSAGRGFSQRVRRASSVVAGEISEIPRRLRTRSRVSSQELREEDVSPIMVTDVERAQEATTETMMDHVAEMLAQARVEEDEAERLAMQSATTGEAHVADESTHENEQTERNTFEPVEAPVAATASAALADAEEGEEDETAHASDAETASTASEDVWDMVYSPSPTRPMSPFLDVEVDDAVEVSYTRWESQLKTIRDIMPQVDADLCVEVLEKYAGNLEATLVELIEL